MKKFGIRLLTVITILSASVACRRENTDVPREPSRPVLAVEDDSFSFSVRGGSAFTKILCNGSVSVGETAPWLEAEIVEDKADSEGSSGLFLKVDVAANDTEDKRSAQVVLSASGCSDVCVSVVQVGLDRPLETTCDLLSFSVKKQGGLKSDLVFSYDEVSRTYKSMYLKWIEGDDPEMMVPVFAHNGERVTVNGKDVVSGHTALSFADDFTIVVEAEDGGRKEYSVSLNCPQINRELPVLHVRPDRRIGDDKVYVPAYIEFYDRTPSSTGTGWWDSSVQGKVEVRKRGNSTWGLPKKPFRIKFPEKVSPIGLDHCCEKSWAVVANDMDKSLLRNYIAFEYSRIMFVRHEGYHDGKALKFTPVAQPVNVYYTGEYYYSDTYRTRQLDGEYLGVFQFSDQMNKGDGRIDVDKLTAADTDPEIISGGYIIECDLHEGNRYSSLKGVKMTYKYPEEDNCNSAQYNYISNFIDEAERVLYSSSYRDPANGWRKYFDEKTLADFIIIKELVGDLDAYTSTYFYKRRGVDKLYFGPIWDCDKGWNNDRRVPHRDADPLTSLMIYAGFLMPPYVDNDWFQRFWSDPSFRQFVNGRWKDKRDELLAVTDRILDEMPVRMAKAVEANFSVWDFYYQYSDEANLPAKTYAEEIERIRTLTYRRAELLDRLFSE